MIETCQTDLTAAYLPYLPHQDQYTPACTSRAACDVLFRGLQIDNEYLPLGLDDTIPDPWYTYTDRKVWLKSHAVYAKFAACCANLRE